MPETIEQAIGAIASLIAHDLAGPVGATANGLDLLADLSVVSSDEAMILSRRATETVMRRLDFFRLAFGQASVAPLQPQQIEKALIGQFSSAGFDCKFISEPDNALIQRDMIQMGVLLVWVVARQLPRGGELVFSYQSTEQVVHLRIAGRASRLRVDEALQGLTLSSQALPQPPESNKTVAWLAGRLLAQRGSTPVWSMIPQQSEGEPAFLLSVTVALGL